MIFPRFRRAAAGPATISGLYGMIVAQARMPCFYREYAVADTINGRFELIVLHLALLLDRLAKDHALRSLGQGIFDCFCRDMDHNLREMGVSDLAVPRQMRRIGEAFYGRSQAYQEALGAKDGQLLVEALNRNIYDGSPAGLTAAPRLAAYVRDALRVLAEQDSAALGAGKLYLPEPNKTFKTMEQEPDSNGK
jgi:cytochrome b pre-mRNA-processing protein 3